MSATDGKKDAEIEIAEDIRQMNFEQALEELEKIVDSLENGDVALEESIKIYQRGNQLRAHCDSKIRDAQSQIEKITGDGSGTEPLDVD